MLNNLRVESPVNVYVFLFQMSKRVFFPPVFFLLQWVPEITHHCPKTPFLLVGTQIDLRDDPSTVEKLAKNKQKPITPETAEKLARDLKAVKYVECSALTQVRSFIKQRPKPLRRACAWMSMSWLWWTCVASSFPNSIWPKKPSSNCVLPVSLLPFPLFVAGTEERIWWGYPSRFRAPWDSEKEKVLFVLMSLCI